MCCWETATALSTAVIYPDRGHRRNGIAAGDLNGDGSYDPGVNYSTGPQNLPNGVALGDLNGDQKLDVIVANSDLFSSTVTVFLGNGDGTLGAKRSVVVDGDATAVAAGDFNGDGKLDVALTTVPSPDFQAGSVTILLGNDRGGLRAGATYTVGAQPSAIVAVDFDGAGTLDLAVTNSQGSSVSVLGGNGDGTFKPVGNFAPGAFPAGIAVGNVNPDRLPDLLVVNQASDNVSLLIGSRLATLKAPQTFATGQGPSTVASGDFNHDGKADAAVINFYENTVSTYFGDGKGGLTQSATYPGGDGPHAIAVADINGETISGGSGWLCRQRVRPRQQYSLGEFLTPLARQSRAPPVTVSRVIRRSTSTPTITSSGNGSRSRTSRIRRLSLTIASPRTRM